MNILLTSLQVPGAASGVRVHYERLAKLLRAEGHHVTVVTQDSLRPWVRRAIGVVRRGLGLLPGRWGERVGIELEKALRGPDPELALRLIYSLDLRFYDSHTAAPPTTPATIPTHFVTSQSLPNSIASTIPGKVAPA